MVNECTSKLLERILDRDNLINAYKKVKQNKGSHGIDNMTVDDLLPYIKQNLKQIRQSILEGTYKPSPVRRVEIPKPDGGKRILGIPTVFDRMIQQAIAQILSPIFDPKFSDNSFGFRPNRYAKQAIEKSKDYIESGYKHIVDIDIARYFDTVNHDKLMSLIAKVIEDKRVLFLIRKYLQSGVMINGIAIDTYEGCPQGGPLSPLLSNIMLNELDKELEKRGLKFCRYADDCNVYVKSRKASERVMKSITHFIEKNLKLKINKEKSTTCKPYNLKYLGFSFYSNRTKNKIGIRIHPESIKRFKLKVKLITGRSNGKSMQWRIDKLRELIIGWINYFGIADMKDTVQKLDEWTRRRLRLCFWKQWKKIKTKHDNLVKLGIDNNKAWQYANTRKSYWRTASSFILTCSITNDYLKKFGYQSISERYSLVH
jgi:RNA-directed DNA polymerase